MLLFFVFFLLLFLSFVNFCVVDYFIWWSVFVICTFVFIFMVYSVSVCDVGCLINYYIIQEICGYYFLLFDSWKLQFLFLMLKSGSSPFHFWVFSVLGGLKKWSVLWFLTLQKLPYFVVLVNFCSDFFFFVLFFGMIICYFQFFLLRSYCDLLFVGSTESFNWLLLLGVFSFNEVFFLFFFYYFVMFFIISYVYSGFVNFFSLEMLMVFFNVPLTITFFLKVLLLFGSGFLVGFYYYFLLLVMPLMSLGIGYFFFLVSMLGFNYGLKYYDYFVWVLFCVSFLSYF
uniref:NADH reductase subunit 2 n=1 Tax=Dirofilaria sp. 'Thailand II' TaxID=1902351 RepID=A0A3Q8LXH2_9BILA|nr:NADH reductase subunit 2 [Dirofilaria sp. 'Thailand II']AZH08567.1 NADH reductase subunit 2 [Dirofilaria sp. 'Thailand II']AZH08573.1 NADH reductase subunit 2 [Dirofilaria sp. 'Thailand II']